MFNPSSNFFNLSLPNPPPPSHPLNFPSHLQHFDFPPHFPTPQDEAERFLEISRRLLLARDLVGAKLFAQRAIDSNPFIPPSADSLLAASSVLLASLSRTPSNHLDFYSILGLDPLLDRKPSSILLRYRRLALLLRHDRHLLPPFSDAAKLVDHAWAVLSDPITKSLYDAEIGLHDPPPTETTTLPLPELNSDANSFWTICGFCFNAHQFEAGYKGRRIRCPNCRKGFAAKPMNGSPPVVPGKKMYYCSWGFFPLGFQKREDLGSSGDDNPGFPEGFKAFYPMFPMGGGGGGEKESAGNDGSGVSVGVRGVAKKSLGVGLRKRVLTSRAEGSDLGINQWRPVIDINEEAGSSRGEQT